MANATVSVTLTLEQAQHIIDDHHKQPTPVASLHELEIHGYSTFTPTKSYKVQLEDGTAYIIKVAHPTTTTTALGAEPAYAPNTLSAEYELLSLLAQHTDVPHATAHKLDTSLTLVPYTYLLFSAPRGIPLAHARASGTLTPRQQLALDLRIGAHLRQIHERVQNDWFGLPAQAAAALYSWQEAFTGLLEGLLHAAQAAGVDLPYETVRHCLSRAIGFFLFDDCEVPSLVSLVGDEGSVMVDVDLEGPPVGEDEEVQITSLLPLSHALWGDPLFEAMFIQPSEAFLEGYGGSPIVFARQKTKRLWYTFFLALSIVLQSMQPQDVASSEASDREEKVKWARDTLGTCVENLRNAPCY